VVKSAVVGYATKAVTITATKDIEYISIFVNSAVTMTNMMLNKGTTALPYKPYQHNTLLIPETVQSLTGYGEGINESDYNYIEWTDEKRLYHRNVARIEFNGTEDWKQSEANGYYVLYLKEMKPGIGKCSHFKYGQSDNRFFIGPAGIAIYKDDCATPTEFKAYLSEQDAAGTPVTVIYALQTPEVIDISDILTYDNFINVKDNGVLIFENEYGYDVPSKVEYQLEV
jgi:hypothetical protein